jgi:Tfp pilus assembly protein PilX
MPTWLIIVLAVLVVLAVGGAIARRRQLAATQDRFDANLHEVNRDLAAAHAEDRGWERSALEDAARRAYAGERDGAEPGELELTQVIDRPGTDDDKAVFRAGPSGRERLTLGRRDGQWVLEALE